jgi:Tfp pilus assembly protein FimT
MIKFSNWAVKITTLSAICIVVVLSLAYFAARFSQNRAEVLIMQLSNVIPGTTSEAVAKNTIQGVRFLKRIPNACENYTHQNCDQFAFTNRWLTFLHLSPAKWIWVTVEYRRGVVVSKSVQLSEAPHITAVTRQLLREIEPPVAGDVFSSRTLTVSVKNTKNAVVKVYDDESVPSDQRQKDWTVDLSCLSRFGTCSDPRAILPRAFPKE